METTTSLNNKGITLTNIERVLKVVIGAGIVYGGYKLGKHFMDKSKAKETAKDEADKVTENSNSSTAQQLKLAIPTDIVSRMIGGTALTNTDEQSVINTFRKIKSKMDLDEIKKSYSNLTQGRSLMDDLSKQMQPKYFKVVTDIFQSVTGQKASTKERVGYKQFVVATQAVNVRKNPVSKKIINANYNQVETKKNIIKLAPTSSRLGISTGKEIYDPEGDTWFVEVRVSLNGNLDTPVYVYVAKGYVKGYNKVEDIPAIYSKKLTISSSEYNDADRLEGIKNKIITKQMAVILSPNFYPIKQVGANTILGEQIMELQTKQKTYVQFRTVQNQLRWVEKNSLQLTK